MKFTTAHLAAFAMATMGALLAVWGVASGGEHARYFKSAGAVSVGMAVLFFPATTRRGRWLWWTVAAAEFVAAGLILAGK